jgi:hypothetical protein
VNAQRSGAAGLLGAAMLGIVAAPIVPRRYGRRGGLGVLGGVSVLLVRDATMALTGTPAEDAAPGAALSRARKRGDGNLPRSRRLAAPCWARSCAK